MVEQRTLIFAAAAVVVAGIAAMYMLAPSSEKAPALDAVEDVDEFETSTSKALDADVEEEGPTEDAAEPAAEPSPSPASQPSDKQATGAQEEEQEDPRMAKMKAFSSAQSLGTKYYKGEKFAKAIEEYTKAIDLAEELDLSQSKLETLYHNRSAAYEKSNKVVESLKDCTMVLSMNPTHAKVRNRRARIYQLQDRPHDALVELCTVLLSEREAAKAKLAQFGDNPQVQQMMMEQLAPKPPEDLEKVMQAVGQADAETFMSQRDANFLKDRQPSANAINQLLLCYKDYLDGEQEAKQLDTAELTTQIKACEELANSHDAAPDLIQALQQRARAHMVRRKYVEAKADVLQAVEVVQANPGVLAGPELAVLLCTAGFFQHMSFCLDEALELYDLAAAADPLSVDVHVKRSGVWIDKNDIDQAEEHINRAAELDPAHTDVLMHRSQVWVLKRDMPKAEADLRACVASYPNHALALLRLATILMHSQQFAEATSIAEQAKTARPNLSEVHQVLGELSIAQGDADGALTNLNEAIKLDSTNPMPHVDKGLVLWQTTMDHVQALAEFDKALEADKFCSMAYMRAAELRMQFVQTFEETEKVIDQLNEAVSVTREKTELHELCMVRGVAIAQLEAAKGLGMSSFSPMAPP